MDWPYSSKIAVWSFRSCADLAWELTEYRCLLEGRRYVLDARFGKIQTRR